MSRWTYLLPAGFFALVGCAQPSQPHAGAIALEQARVAPPLGGKDMTAAYVAIRNKGGADRLIGVSSSAAQHGELHTSEEAGGLMRMRRLEGLEIPAGGVIAFAPGGLHIMLFGVSGLREGQEIPLRLTFEKAGVVEIAAPVAPAGDAGMRDH